VPPRYHILVQNPGEASLKEQIKRLQADNMNGAERQLPISSPTSPPSSFSPSPQSGDPLSLSLPIRRQTKKHKKELALPLIKQRTDVACTFLVSGQHQGLTKPRSPANRKNSSTGKSQNRSSLETWYHVEVRSNVACKLVLRSWKHFQEFYQKLSKIIELKKEEKLVSKV